MIFGVRNWSHRAIVRHYLHNPTFSRFDTIPECDRQTHRQTHTQTHDNGIYSASRVLCCKNVTKLGYAKISMPYDQCSWQSITCRALACETFAMSTLATPIEPKSSKIGTSPAPSLSMSNITLWGFMSLNNNKLHHLQTSSQDNCIESAQLIEEITCSL